MGLIPVTREASRRLGLVTIGQMVNALASAADDEPDGVRTWGFPEIRGPR